MVLTNVLALPNTDNPQLEILGASVPPWGQEVLAPIVFSGWLLSALVGGVVGSIAVARDRPLLLLVAQVQGLIIFAFFVWIGVSMQVGGEADMRVSLPIAVLLRAVANLVLIHLAGNGGERTSWNSVKLDFSHSRRVADRIG